jgi:hypothetical protein
VRAAGTSDDVRATEGPRVRRAGGT